MNAEIPLTRGLVAVVDAVDFAHVTAAGPWIASPAGRTFYAERKVRRPDGRKTTQRLHTFLTGWPRVDHRNGDGLDNTRANLRQATHAQNMMNRGPNANNASGYKGVCWHREVGRWKAEITKDGRSRHLGLFDTAEEAARAYDTAARELHGEFAWTNLPAESA